MSRCYPFPPPGYAGKCSSHEALILSIKLQKERERAVSDSGPEKLTPEKSKSSEKRKDKEDRKKDKKSKEERREKKEKKEKRKEKKQKTSAPVENGKLDNVAKLPKAGIMASESTLKNLLGSSTELLERSIVTEEHGRPVDSQNASCSSDSTGNSGKRKKMAAASPSGIQIAASPSRIQSNGNIIRIRFSSSQKRDEPSTSGSKEQESGPVPYTTSHSHVRPGVSFAKPEPSLKTKEMITAGLALAPTASMSTATLQVVPSVDDISRLKEKTTENVTLKEKPSSHDKSKSSKSMEKLSSRDKKMKKKESLYQKLFVDWVAPPLERPLVVDENDDDEEWLLGKKGEDRSAKRLRLTDESQSTVDNISCSASSVMQPRAHLLADVGIYALPFTVPL